MYLCIPAWASIAGKLTFCNGSESTVQSLPCTFKFARLFHSAFKVSLSHILLNVHCSKLVAEDLYPDRDAGSMCLCQHNVGHKLIYTVVSNSMSICLQAACSACKKFPSICKRSPNISSSLLLIEIQCTPLSKLKSLHCTLQNSWSSCDTARICLQTQCDISRSCLQT